MITVLVVGECTREVITDICMTSRAFGASKVAFTCGEDRKVAGAMRKVSKEWGGKFSIMFNADYKEMLNGSPNYKTVFLTQYGIPVEKAKHSIRTYKNMMVVVALSDSYTKKLIDAADFNISITSQPHSSTSAVAVFLHTYFNGRENAMQFENAMTKVLPSEHGIRVQKRK